MNYDHVQRTDREWNCGACMQFQPRAAQERGKETAGRTFCAVRPAGCFFCRLWVKRIMQANCSRETRRCNVGWEKKTGPTFDLRAVSQAKCLGPIFLFFIFYFLCEEGLCEEEGFFLVVLQI